MINTITVQEGVVYWVQAGAACTDCEQVQAAMWLTCLDLQSTPHPEEPAHILPAPATKTTLSG